MIIHKNTFKYVFIISIFILFTIFFFYFLFAKNNQTLFIIENMDNLDNSLTNLENSFCEIHKASSGKLEESCNNLTKDNCNKVSCCVHINGNKCVAGSNNGHTYKTDKNGEKIHVDYYYYKNKCVGNCPKD